MSGKLLTILFVFAIFSLAVVLPPAPAGEEAKGKWISLFNGKDLSGWTPKVSGYPAGENVLSVFKVQDGAIRVDYSGFDKFDGRFGHLFYKDKFSDYVLQLEYRIVGELMHDAPSWCYRNSGVMVHSQSAASMGLDQDFPVSLEVQFLSSTDSVRQTTANLCTPGTTVEYKGQFTEEHCISSTSPYYPDSVWVKAEVVVRGNRIVHHLINGDTVFTFTHPRLGGEYLPGDYPLPGGTLLSEGYIALQAEAQPIEFRNIRLKVLKKDQ